MSKNKKKIVFLTGTRADYGKIKSLIFAVSKYKNYEPIIFVTGIHLQRKYGYTITEIQKDFKNIKIFKLKNYKRKYTMDLTLALTIKLINKYLKITGPDLVVIHGDRVETLAAAISCNLNNILISHIEGGEVSGTVDELLRHSTSKLSHTHFVSNSRARKILRLLGEEKSTIYVMGSPEVDLMTDKKLPKIHDVKKRYQIKFQNYSIAILHPIVNMDKRKFNKQVKIFFNSIVKSKCNYVVIYPNNDLNSEGILKEINKIRKKNNFKIIPSIRFEFYLSLLKNSDFIIGNSSSGVREAPVFGIKSINIGNRQKNRAKSVLIKNINFKTNEILKTINLYKNKKNSKLRKNYLFGKGSSSKKFLNILNKKSFWQTNKEKYFSI